MAGKIAKVLGARRPGPKIREGETARAFQDAEVPRYTRPLNELQQRVDMLATRVHHIQTALGQHITEDEK